MTTAIASEKKGAMVLVCYIVDEKSMFSLATLNSRAEVPEKNKERGKIIYIDWIIASKQANKLMNV